MQKTIYSRTYESESGSVKFKLACEDSLKKDPDWLHIKRYLSRKDFNILLGSLKNYKDIIVKFGDLHEINKEYSFSKTAYDHRLPNFIKFLCSFTCQDSVDSIKKRDFSKDSYICREANGVIGCIIMPYYSLGSIDSYRWNRNNFDILKNVLHQTTFAYLYAYEEFQFIHGDLHLGNVLLRRSKKIEIDYGPRKVASEGIYPIIMDFGRSYTSASAKEMYLNLKRFFGLIESISNATIATDTDSVRRLLMRYIDEDRGVDSDVYTSLEKAIEDIRIVHEYKTPIRGLDSKS